MEKYLERWSKISSQQAELGSVGSGLACANLGIVERGEGPKVCRTVLSLKELEPRTLMFERVGGSPDRAGSDGSGIDESPATFGKRRTQGCRSLCRSRNPETPPRN